MTDDDAWRPPAHSGGPTPGSESGASSRLGATEELVGYADLVEIGRGGDSVVFRAHEEGLSRLVAIKVIDVADPARAARFRREVEITVDLGRQHPNIVTVLAIGTTASGRPAIVMDYAEGGTLHDRLKARGTFEPDEVGRIGEVLADALAFAHERGVLHRDVKPHNVLVLPTSWVLTDFGIARLVDSEHTASVETFTYRHCAPQILDGHAPTAADDIWSLGSTLYTLLDGRPPFTSDDAEEDSALAYIRRARTEAPRPLQVPGAEGLVAIINRCLTKDVAQRYATAAELRDALRSLRASAWEPPSVVRDTTAERPQPASPVPLDVVRAGTAPRPTVEPTPEPTPAPPPDPTPDPTPESTPLSTVPEPEPAPVAVSAVSHVARAVDSAPTGSVGAAVGRSSDTDLTQSAADVERETQPATPASSVEEAERTPRRRLPILLGVAALVIGLGLGIVGAALRGDGEAPPPAGDPTTQSTNAPIGGPTEGNPPGTTLDPKLAPVFVDLRYEAGFLDLDWSDPTGGEGAFSLVRLEGKTTILEWELGTGEVAARIPLEPAYGRTCYRILVEMTDGRLGVSDKRCVRREPGT